MKTLSKVVTCAWWLSVIDPITSLIVIAFGDRQTKDCLIPPLIFIEAAALALAGIGLYYVRSRSANKPRSPVNTTRVGLPPNRNKPGRK